VRTYSKNESKVCQKRKYGKECQRANSYAELYTINVEILTKLRLQLHSKSFQKNPLDRVDELHYIMQLEHPLYERTPFISES